MNGSALAVGLTPMESRRDVVLHVAETAERLGYSGFHLAEGWGHDAGVLLAEVAAHTTRIRLGTGVLNVWGRSPAQIAMLAGSLDDASGGRFQLGLGAGSPQLAAGLHGRAFTEPVARLGTVTRQVRTLLAGGRAQERGLRLATAPHPHVPIGLAALGPRAVQLAGEVADSWIPFLLPRSALKENIARVDAAAAAAGRARPRIAPALPVAISDDPARARERAEWWVVQYLTGMGPLYARTLRRAGMGAEVDSVVASAGVPTSLLDELTVRGDAETARDTLDAWYAEGAEEIAVVLPPGAPVEELDHALEALVRP
jgi:alkanesulfonate monooxygenase SsuD/methylene tetrahydromethanopterin reductase-like flavin-dependent oxidoreductase (luciferase family)